ncbi:MAG: folylpolyglutamate synthase/dihydrofolate synthase family protein [Balneolaceae bacterium]
MSRFKAIEDVWAFLNDIPMFQKSGFSAVNFSLGNIREFCSELGNPHLDFPVIHVAGTNGKGTTCYMLEKIYQDAGYKTGLFTSPHLLRYNERVRVGGEEISDESMLEFFQISDELFDKIGLSYFEISTALAFWHFSKQEIELAFIETGLGGRFDSTNIVDPEISVITSIGLDHQNILGNTVEEIALEKSGIIKTNKPLVIGNVEGKAVRVIEREAQKKQVKITYADALEPKWEKGIVSFKTLGVNIPTPLKESVNRWNVACAWQVCKLLTSLFPVSDEAFIQSIKTFPGAPGRFEKLHPHYDWYFSGSHNIQALDASLEAVREITPLKDAVLIFSAMKDKLSSDMLNRLKPFKMRYFVEQEGERAAKMKDVASALEVILMDKKNAQIILKELKTELVIFAGSFYFYPIVKRWITKVQ